MKLEWSSVVPFAQVQSYASDDNSAYLAANGEVARIDLRSGVVLWMRATRHRGQSRPLVLNSGCLYLCTVTEKGRTLVSRLDKESGSVDSVLQIVHEVDSRAVVVSGKTLISSFSRDRGKIVSADLWELSDGSFRPAREMEFDPISFGKTVYIGGDSVYRLDLESVGLGMPEETWIVGSSAIAKYQGVDTEYHPGYGVPPKTTALARIDLQPRVWLRWMYQSLQAGSTFPLEDLWDIVVSETQIWGVSLKGIVRFNADGQIERIYPTGTAVLTHDGWKEPLLLLRDKSSARLIGAKTNKVAGTGLELGQSGTYFYVPTAKRLLVGRQELKDGEAHLELRSYPIRH